MRYATPVMQMNLFQSLRVSYSDKTEQELREEKREVISSLYDTRKISQPSLFHSLPVSRTHKTRRQLKEERWSAISASYDMRERIQAQSDKREKRDRIRSRISQRLQRREIAHRPKIAITGLYNPV